MPVSHVPAFLHEADEAVLRLMPGARLVSFGHLGDGNIHYNVSQPIGMDKERFLAMWNEMNDAVFEVVGRFDGSISAEHGIGRLKAYRMPAIKSAVELEMMRGHQAHAGPQRHHQPRARSPAMSGFRDIGDDDVEPVVALWQDCGLTRPWNDPYKDISFARSLENATVLVLEREGRIIATVMTGHDGHRGMLYYVAVDPATPPARPRQGGGERCRRLACQAWRVEDEPAIARAKMPR